MNVRIQGMLATAAAAAAALLTGAYTARADGMPPAPAASQRPVTTSWTGFYVGFESGWDWDSVDFKGPPNTRTLKSTWDRDVVNAGIFVGYQYQYRSFVFGLEASLIGNAFDDSHDDGVRGSVGNCESGVGTRLFNCVGRITDIITVGPRLGYVIDHPWGGFMPYVTGGYAFGNFDNKEICGATGLNCNHPFTPGPPASNFGPTGSGTAQVVGQSGADGWFVGGGLDYKIADHVVVGIEYRHVDLGTVTVSNFNPANGAFLEHERVSGTSDAVLLRGSLLFGAREIAGPLK